MATTKELLYAETDGACAICGNKDFRVLTVHHIEQEDPKNEAYDNKILLCHNCHHLYHDNKGPTLTAIRTIKKRLIYRTLTQQGVNALKEATRKGVVVGSPHALNHLVEMRLLKFKGVITGLTTGDNRSTAVNAAYELTPDGIAFTKKWRLR